MWKITLLAANSSFYYQIWSHYNHFVPTDHIFHSKKCCPKIQNWGMVKIKKASANNVMGPNHNNIYWGQKGGSNVLKCSTILLQNISKFQLSDSTRENWAVSWHELEHLQGTKVERGVISENELASVLDTLKCIMKGL